MNGIPKDKTPGGLLTRRGLLSGAAAAGGVALAAPYYIRPAGAQSAGRVIYATWGGSWEEAIRKAWFEPFTAATGIEVVTAQDNTYGKFQSMVESGTTEWDVVEVNPDFTFIGAKRGLLEPLDFTVINREPIMEGEGFVTEYSVPQVLWSYVLGYNTDLLKTAPSGAVDMFNLTDFAGKRSIYSNPNSSALETALLADGVAPGELYPMDIDRALAKLDEIRSDLIFYETNAQAQQYVSDGTAAMLIMPDGRAMSAIESGAPVAIQYNQSFMTWSSMVAPKGCPNRENAMKLLAWTMTPEAQAAIANAYTYGPVVPAAFDMIDEARANILSGGPQQQGKFIMLNAEWWAENYEDATERLTEWRLM